MIGNHQEEPSVSPELFSLGLTPRYQVIKELFDVSRGKPFYNMAPDVPLLFYEATYDELDFLYEPGSWHSVRILTKNDRFFFR